MHIIDGLCYDVDLEMIDGLCYDVDLEMSDEIDSSIDGYTGCNRCHNSF